MGELKIAKIGKRWVVISKESAGLTRIWAHFKNQAAALCYLAAMTCDIDE